MRKQLIIEKLLNEKAGKNNTIDLNAYAIGLDDMYRALVLHGVIKSVCNECTAYLFYERGKTPICKTCKEGSLFNDIGDFVEKTFPDAGSIEHIKKLKHEADEIIKNPKDVEEYADVLIALFGAARKAEITYTQLMNASESKLKLLKERKWVRLDDGTYQHET